MYYPFVRGKQFELMMLREKAIQIATWGFIPVIEPVKGNFPALNRALDELVKSKCRFILVSNPGVGELKEDNSSLWSEIIDGVLHDYDNFSVGLSLTAEDKLESASDFFNNHKDKRTAVIHNGFSEGVKLSALIAEIKPNLTEHIFVGTERTLYQRHFKGILRVLIQDGFESQTANKHYPPTEPFSDIYLTYQERGFDAFGDYLMVGSGFKDGGGPAYAIAIHLTFANPDAENAIAINHYLSDQVDTPKDPAGKFLEALSKLVNDVERKDSPIFQSDAVKEYLQLYKDQHFPGLGYVKKLSMQHHIELMAHLLGKG